VLGWHVCVERLYCERIRVRDRIDGAGLPENPSVPRPMLLELPFVLRRVNVLLEGWLDRCARDEVRNRDCMHGCDATKRGAGGNRGG